MPTSKKPVIAICAPVSITAGEAQGEKQGPAKFVSEFYTGGALEIDGWDLPVVVDLAGLKPAKVLVANQYHDQKRPVGNFEVANNGKSLVANGTATAATEARDEVVNSALAGYQWQSSLEVNPREVEEIKAGKTVEVNGQSFKGPLYVTRRGTLKGFGFVSHGADDNTTATIAATAADKEKRMKAEVAKWLKAMLPSVDVDSLTPEEITAAEADYEGRSTIIEAKPKKRLKLDEEIDAKQAEADRVEGITEIALGACDKRPYDIKAIKELAETAINGKWTIEKFRLELLEAALPPAHTVFRTGKENGRLTNKIIEAAICQSGRLPEKDANGRPYFDDQTMQAAHDRFKGKIGLKQFLLLAAETNGHANGYSQDVDREVLRAAFASKDRSMIRAAGFSTIDVDSITANTANKFLLVGWMSVDQAPLQLAAIRNVRDFKTATTVSLTGDAQYTKVGPAGEIKHATLGELTYTYNADTYAAMLAITRQDIINDDLGALTDVPQRLGRGAMLKLNDIFWTAFLGAESSGFFAAGNNNLNTGVADVTVGGLDATYTIFKNQTDPDGKPLALEPMIWAVPTAQYGAALRLMNSELLIDGTSTGLGGNANIWRGRFTVVTSPYMSNSSYTGNSSTASYLLASPAVLPTIVIAALNGRVEPTVDTADADFNTLGIQMRGYSDVGVALFEKRAAVKADGGSS